MAVSRPAPVPLGAGVANLARTGQMSLIRLGNIGHHRDVFEIFQIYLEARRIEFRIRNRPELGRTPGKQAVVAAMQGPYSRDGRFKPNLCRTGFASCANWRGVLARC
jgi:hypothetical protein